LICDWWFKVDCNSAPEHYAESSEQLQRAQRLRQQKLRHVVRSEQGFGASGEIFFRNDARAAESIQKPAAVRLPQGRSFRAPNSNINKRMDNNADDANKSGENPNASEILYARRNIRKGKSNDDEEAKGREIQDTAETASFVKDRSTYNGYSYPVPEKANGYEYSNPEKSGYQYLPPQQGYNYEAPRPDIKLVQSNAKSEKIKNNKIFLSEPQPFNTRPTEMYASTVAKLEVSSTSRSPVGKSFVAATTQRPQSKSTASTTTVTRRGSTTYQSSLKTSEVKSSISSRIQAVNSVVAKTLKTTTPSYESTKINTYSTARKSNGKTKETPFYTPTIPTIRETPTTTTLSPTTTTEVPETSTKPTNSEIVKHALEMMESLKDLDMASVIPPEAERYMGMRTGLEVPPSSGPNALHSLALYFANGDTNNTKRMTEEQKALALSQGIASVFLSDKTVTKYEALFPGENKSPTEPSAFKIMEFSQTDSRNNDEDDDLETQHSKNPVLSAAGTPQLREIAQVFTHALSAYLQDPEQFRKILSEIRPTQPPPIQSNEIPRFAGENEFVRQESAYNIPRATATTGKPEELEIFDFSDVTTSPKTYESETTENFDEITTTEPTIISTTYYPHVTETLPPASSNLADKTPGSRLLTEQLEKTANENFNTRQGKDLDQSLGLLADEINGGLGSTSQFDFGYGNSNENEDRSYFPEEKGSKSKLTPYGFGVKPENSTPIHDTFPTALSDTQAVPLRWGEDLTTVQPLDDANAYPTVFSDLLPPYDINGTEVFNIPSNDIQLPSEENDEALQQAQSQSFVSGRNNIYTELKKSKTYNDYLNYNEEFLLGTTNFGEKIVTTTEIPQTTTVKGHFVTKSIPVTTTNVPDTTTYEYPTTTSYSESVRTTLPDSGTYNTDSKTTLSYTVFLDPLNINDGLMESDDDSTVTPSPNTYLPRDSTSTEDVDQVSETTYATTQRRGKSSFATTPLTIRFAGDETNIVEPMQKRANEMFGNLNETQVNHLMNVMKKAEENRTVKRLILLLIQTCDGDDHNKTLEESRSALLNALIGMDNAGNGDKRNEIKIINTRREKTFRSTTITTTPIPITTYKSPYHEKYTSSESASKEQEDIEGTTVSFDQTTNFPSRSNFVESEITTQEAQVITTEAEITTTEIPVTTSTTEKPITFPSKTRSRSIESKPKFRLKTNASLKTSSENVRHQKSLGTHEEFVAEASQNTSIEHKRADARALELLRSLYSLASRWGK
jgi:hypothetical protein